MRNVLVIVLFAAIGLLAEGAGVLGYAYSSVVEDVRAAALSRIEEYLEGQEGLLSLYGSSRLDKAAQEVCEELASEEGRTGYVRGPLWRLVDAVNATGYKVAAFDYDLRMMLLGEFVPPVEAAHVLVDSFLEDGGLSDERLISTGALELGIGFCAVTYAGGDVNSGIRGVEGGSGYLMVLMLGRQSVEMGYIQCGRLYVDADGDGDCDEMLGAVGVPYTFSGSEGVSGMDGGYCVSRSLLGGGELSFDQDWWVEGIHHQWGAVQDYLSVDFCLKYQARRLAE